MKQSNSQRFQNKAELKSWLIQQVTYLSYQAENFSLNHILFIFFSRFTEMVLLFVVPLLTLIQLPNSSLNTIKPYFQIICSAFIQKFNKQPFIVLTIQIFFCSLTTPICLLLFLKSLPKANKGCLYLLSILYPMTPFLLFVQGQIIMYLFNSISQRFMKTITIVTIWNILMIGIICILYKVIYSTYSPFSLNHLCSKFSISNIVLSCIGRILSIFTPFLVKTQLVKNSNVNVSLFYCLILITFSIAHLKNQINDSTYYSDDATKIHEYCLAFELSISLICFVLQVSQVNEISQNFHFITFTFFIFAYMTLIAQKSNSIGTLSMQKQQQIDTQEKAERYIIQLSHILTRTDNHTHSLLLSKIMEDHTAVCYDPSCNCVNKQSLNKEERDEYYDKIIQTIIKRILDKFNDSQKLIILVSYLKLKLYKKYVRSLQMIKNKMGNGQNSLFLDFIFHKFIYSIMEYLDVQNRQRNIARIENCVESDNYLKQVMSYVIKAVKLKQTFWGYFSKGSVSTQEFERNINEQLCLMKKLHSCFIQIFHKFANSFTLISLLIAYEKYIVMKEKLSSRIYDTAKTLSKRDKGTAILKNQKNQRNSAEKSIYSSRSCVIEITVESTKLGTVISSSKNVENVLGYEPSNIKGININRIMPQSMQEEHNYLLNNWKQKCSWQKIGKYRAIFGVDKKHVSFSTQIYFKPIFRLNSVNVMAGIFKENDQDFMIVDNNGCIVGAGQKYFQILGPVIVGLPLNFVCMQAHNIQKWAQLDQRIRYKSIFYPTRHCESVLRQFLKKKYEIRSLSRSSQDLISQIRRPQKGGTVDDVTIEFQVYPYRIGRIIFSVIKIEHVTNDSSKGKSLNISFNDQTNKTHDFDRNSIRTMRESEKSFLACNLSVGSSNFSSLQSSQNNISYFESIFFQKQKLSDSKIVRVSVLIVIICFACLNLIVGKIILSFNGFAQFQEILAAKSECKSNMQLAILTFNQGLILQKYFGNQTLEYDLQLLKFEIGVTKLQIEQQRQSLVSHISKTNQQKASLSHTRLFNFYNNPVEWKMNEKQSTNIHLSQFLINYIYLMKDITQCAENLANGTDSSQNHKMIEYYLNMMKNNFDTLTGQLTLNMQLFQQMTMEANKHIGMISCIKIALILVFYIGILFILRKYYSFRMYQQNQVLKQFQQFPVEMANILSQHFQILNQVFTKYQSKLDNVQTAENIFKQMQITYEESFPHHFSINSTNIKNKLRLHQKTLKLWTILSILSIAILILINLASVYIQNQVMNDNLKVMQNHYRLIQSQTTLMTIYFSFKSSSDHSYQKNNEIHAQQLLRRIDKYSVNSVDEIVSSLQMLNRKNKNWSPTFSQTLQTLCKSSQLKTVPESISWFCTQISPPQLINNGIITIMIYFHRSLYQSVHEYIQNNKFGPTNQQPPNFDKLEIIDKSLFFIFLAFQEIQQVIIKFLQSIINKKRIYLMIIAVAELGIFISIMMFMASFYSKQHGGIAKRMGKVLILPQRYLKKNRQLFKILQHIIDYRNVK